MYDYLIVGTGLYGAVFAREMADKGKKVLVLEKRNHIAGNIYTENVQGIQVHKYGAHIFHTNHEDVWKYVNRFTGFNQYIHSPIANFKGEFYPLPFHMNTFQKIWGDISPDKAKEMIERQRKDAGIITPMNLEEQAISLVGYDIYERLIKGYTEKQWGRKCKDLPPFIIKRIPVRFNYDNQYFDAKYQGIAVEGYTKMIENMLEGIEIRLDTDYLLEKEKWNQMAYQIVYTGPIDAYFDYCYGELEYREVGFETQILEIDDFQHCAVVNYTDKEIPYTRIIEHKWFLPEKKIPNKTIISKEYSKKWIRGNEPYYPINDEKNNALYQEYFKLAQKETKVLFGGRLGEYQYYDMDKVIEKALEQTKKIRES